MELVTGLDHVSITTPEELEQEVLKWYESVFELTRATKPEGTRSKGGWFQIGDVQLHLTVDEHNPPRISHYCLVVSDFDLTIERLRSANCHIEQAAAIPGRKRFYTRDPAGNRIEVTAYVEDH